MFSTLNTPDLINVQSACRYIFPSQMINPDFIKHLTPETLKHAYRQKANQLHPDRQRQTDFRTRDAFINVTNAYKLIDHFIRNQFSQLKLDFGKKKTIIAVGGAKGGIGKSIFSVNLGVWLCQHGLRTVLVDLDLGGANLHLYLGEKNLIRKSINDFIRNRVSSLEEIITTSQAGPKFIGGDSSELGASNIQFTQKFKLLKAIHNLDADFIIMDLGGDTAYNILDFFLTADYGIILTTQEAPAYIGAYHFIKACLYRKLNRLFGPEFGWEKNKDEKLERFLALVMSDPLEHKINTIQDLLDKASLLDLDHSVISRAIETFKPYLVLNKWTPAIDSNQVVDKIQNVSRRWLSKEIKFIGNLSLAPEIEKSSINLIPAVVSHPNGALAGELQAIITNLFH